MLQVRPPGVAAVVFLEQVLGRSLAQRGGHLALGMSLLVLGVVLGALGVGALGERDRMELVALVSGHLAALGQGGALGRLEPGPALALAVRNLRLVAFLWLLGLTVAGSLVGLGLLFFRGFVAGFAAGFLSAQLGWRGAVLAAAGLLPHNLVAIPALALAGAGALDFALAVVQGRARRSRSHFYRELGDYTRWMAGAGALAVVAALVEGWVTPLLLGLAARLALAP